MCREILSTCVRNTEEADRAARGGESGRKAGKGVWGMIEESKLAKSIRLDEEKKVRFYVFCLLCDAHVTCKSETDIVVRARLYVTQLTAITDPQSPVSHSPISQPPVLEVVTKAKAMVTELTSVIQETEDPIRLEELLGINDQLLTLLKNVPIKLKQTLKLQGLGLSIDNGSNTAIEVDDKLDGYPHLNGRLNGHTASIETCSETNSIETDDESTTPTTPSTPKVDKGKRRAEPEETEMVLSPKTFMIGEPDNHEEESYEDEGISPMDRYIPRKDASSVYNSSKSFELQIAYIGRGRGRGV